MPNLVVFPNDPNKDAQTQFRQIASNAQDLELWSNNILTKLSVDYNEPQSSTDETTSSTNYVDLANFTKNFTINNPLCTVNFNLTLKGIGVVAVVVNQQLVREIFFQNTGFTAVVHSAFYTMRNGSNQISLKWKASTGSVSKANTSINPGLNMIQVVSQNS